MEATMKTFKVMSSGITAMLLMADPALAVDTSRVYNSGILVSVFLAFCALIVLVQLMPTIMLLIGFFKGLFKKSDKVARDHVSSN
jgi:hypothetical protein